ncbi:MAG: glycosyltransferase [Bacteroidales bacterium]|jgi:glycosyltransferase involved in cell wall biosynthesis|nr:glycosyltransferase [Bacteroidales bacterium]
MSELHLTVPIAILLVVFAVSVLLQLIYYLLFYLRVAAYRPEEKKENKEAVSVIICARNEAENLEVFLPAVLEQEYDDFEVIVVDDCSDDNTEEVLDKYTRQYSNLKVTKIHKESSLMHGKKMALFLGIKAAKNELLLLTDADCQPVSSKWIAGFASHFNDTTDFVLGYGAYLREKGLLNSYIRYDTMFIAMQYAGMAMAGFPYMGVGRNLAYRRSLFMKNKGFGPNINLQSGDDDLFVNKLAGKKNTAVNLDPDSFTRSIPSRTWKEFYKQKTRHLSAASHYRLFSKIILTAEPLSRLLFYSLLIVLFFLTGLYTILAIAAATVIICKLVILGLAQKNLNEKDLLVISLLFDVISPFVNVYFLLNVAFKRHRYYEWK